MFCKVTPILDVMTAVEDGGSTRRVRFNETRRAAPSREMILQLYQSMDVPLRESNALLTAGGFAAVQWILTAHDLYPALAIDRHGNLLVANRAETGLLAGMDPTLTPPRVNVLQLSFHPRRIAPRIANGASGTDICGTG